MDALINTLIYALSLYWWVIIASAIFSWLYAFNVVNPRNPVVGTIGNMLYRLTEPVLRPIRRFMPSTGGLDLSFLVLWFGILLLEQIIVRYVYPYVF